MKTVVDYYGRTAEEFLDELFEYETCAECGGDACDHEASVLMEDRNGEVVWFAYCLNPYTDEELNAFLDGCNG